jgi:hypothetical protein
MFVVLFKNQMGGMECSDYEGGFLKCMMELVFRLGQVRFKSVFILLFGIF